MLEWLEVDSRADVAFARQKARALARQAAFAEARAEEIAIVATELVSNIVKFAGEGRFLAQMMDLPGGPRLAMVASDSGPGIPDIDRMRRDLISSGESAGIGIGAIERLSDRAEVLTGPAAGTIWACTFDGSRTAATDGAALLDVAALRLCHPTESVCGDDWRALGTPDGLRFALADGMGHGPKAAEAGTRMAEGAVGLFGAPPKERLQTLVGSMRRTRGGVISVLDFHPEAGHVDYGNLGNISGLRMRGIEQTRLPMRDGYVGSPAARPIEERFDLKPGDTFVLHSDGIRTVDGDLLRRLTGRGSLMVAAAILSRRDLARRDDIGIGVVRWTPNEPTDD